jgi:hypothetical protein
MLTTEESKRLQNCPVSLIRLFFFYFDLTLLKNVLVPFVEHQIGLPVLYLIIISSRLTFL